MKRKGIVVIALAIMFAFAMFAGQGLSAQANSQTNIGDVSEQKVINRATLDDNFTENFVIITLTREASRRFLTYTPKDFSEIDCVGVEDLTEYTVDFVARQYDKEKVQLQSSKDDKLELSLGKNDMLKMTYVKQQYDKGNTQFQYPIQDCKNDMLVDFNAFRRILCLEINDGSKEEVKQNLKNYSFKYSYSFTEGEETSSINYIDMRTEEAWMFSTEDSGDAFIFLANKVTNSLYMLNDEDKMGMKMDLDEDFDSFEGWGNHLFSWYTNSDSFNKTGTSTVVGRSCKVYEYSFGTLHYSYYIDTEYDLCLKFETTESSASMTSTFLFTEFKMGGVKTEDIMSVLDDYEIEDYSGI